MYEICFNDCDKIVDAIDEWVISHFAGYISRFALAFKVNKIHVSAHLIKSCRLDIYISRNYIENRREIIPETRILQFVLGNCPK